MSTALTRVCNIALDAIPGFVWITHFVNYNNFPKSLLIVSVFGTDDELSRARKAQHDVQLHELIRTQLQALGAPINVTRKQTLCDSETSCQRDNNGNWQQRYQRLH